MNEFPLRIGEKRVLFFLPPSLCFFFSFFFFFSFSLSFFLPVFLSRDESTSRKNNFLYRETDLFPENATKAGTLLSLHFPGITCSLYSSESGVLRGGPQSQLRWQEKGEWSYLALIPPGFIYALRHWGNHLAPSLHLLSVRQHCLPTPQLTPIQPHPIHLLPCKWVSCWQFSCPNSVLHFID